MEDIKAVDVMNYPFTPKLQEIFLGWPRIADYAEEYL